MIVFRRASAPSPFLWETAEQPPGRWHGEGEGPAQYFADTPDGAWAEFLRHENITDPEDLRLFGKPDGLIVRQLEALTDLHAQHTREVLRIAARQFGKVVFEAVDEKTAAGH